MKVLVIGGSSSLDSRTARMLAALRQACDSDVEVVHRPDVKMRGHRADILIVDEVQSIRDKDLLFLERYGNSVPLVQMDYAVLERRMLYNYRSTPFRACEHMVPQFESIKPKPKPNTGPRGRWGKAL